MKIIKTSGYSAPVTGLVFFTGGVVPQAMNIDQPGRDIADDDSRLSAAFLPGLTGKYK